MKKIKRVKILVDDAITGRYKAGDTARVISVDRKAPLPYHVKLLRRVKLNGKGLARNQHFAKHQVKEL